MSKWRTISMPTREQRLPPQLRTHLPNLSSFSLLFQSSATGEYLTHRWALPRIVRFYDRHLRPEDRNSRRRKIFTSRTRTSARNKTDALPRSGGAGTQLERRRSLPAFLPAGCFFAVKRTLFVVAVLIAEASSPGLNRRTEGTPHRFPRPALERARISLARHGPAMLSSCRPQRQPSQTSLAASVATAFRSARLALERSERAKRTMA